MSPKIYFLLIILVVSCATGTGTRSHKAILQGHDALVLNGDQTEIKAKLEDDSMLRRDLKGFSIEFSLNGKIIGVVKTDDDGIAKLRWIPTGLGTYKIGLKLVANPGYKASEHYAIVRVIGEKKLVFVVDIDNTIAMSDPVSFLFGDSSKIRPMPGAQEALKELASRWQILYLTARLDNFVGKTKLWLDYWKFPKAPVYFWGLFGNLPFDRSKYKALILNRLRKRHQNILVGVGDRPHDIRAYRQNGLRAYFLNDFGERMPYDDAVRVRSWREILEHLKKNPVGSLRRDPAIH